MINLSEVPAKIRILVLDEQPLLRCGVSAHLNSQPDMMVCGEAASTADARNKIVECQPQLLLTALQLRTGDSLSFIKKLKAEMPRLRILVYSALKERFFADRAIRAGATGYVMKQAPTDTLTIAIREVMNGGIYVSREVALSAFRKSLPKNRRGLRSVRALEQLSDREMHVFQLLGSGFANRQIAASLDLSVKTVESHQENIKHKLDVSSCAELRRRATKWVEQTFCAQGQVCGGVYRERKTKAASKASPALEIVNAETEAAISLSAPPLYAQ